jgi:hypothetical protein
MDSNLKLDSETVIINETSDRDDYVRYRCARRHLHKTYKERIKAIREFVEARAVIRQHLEIIWPDSADDDVNDIVVSAGPMTKEEALIEMDAAICDFEKSDLRLRHAREILLALTKSEEIRKRK